MPRLASIAPLALPALLAQLATTAAAQPVRIPVRYDEGRWILRPVTQRGDTLDLYTDSGGGVVYVSREALERAGVALTFDAMMQGDSTFRAPLPAFRPALGVPAPLGDGTGTVMSVSAEVRPDGNFHQYMSQWMDRRIKGALGGSGLRYYRVTADYRNQHATFSIPSARP